MTGHQDPDRARYFVALNEMSQYTLLPESQTFPSRWTRIGPARTLGAAMTWLSANWPDMSPTTLVTHDANETDDRTKAHRLTRG
jgi:uncharacterized protein YbdZ (MbtH family)